jgi:diaminopimelate epimerase
VAVGRRWGLLEKEVNVDLPGGRLIITWPGAGEPLWMTGPTATVFEGRVDLTGAPRPMNPREALNKERSE